MSPALNEIIRCLKSDLNTTAGRIRYAEMIGRSGNPEYLKAAEYFKKLQKQKEGEA